MSSFRGIKPSPDHLGLVCLALGLDGEVRWRNTAALRLGSSQSQSPKQLTDLVHPDDRATIETMLEAGRDHGYAADTVRVLNALTGSVRYFQLLLTETGATSSARAGRNSEAAMSSTLSRTVTRSTGGFLAQAWDVTTLVERQDELEVHAFRDGLTGVANRRTFMTCLDQQLNIFRRQCQPVAVLFADVDNFKTINDTHGHQMGDQVLVRVAALLTSVLRPDDLLARIGGDEFAVICPNLSGWPSACAVVDRLRTAVATPISISGETITVTISVGIAFAEEIPERRDAAAHLIALADMRMFRAKLSDRTPAEH